MKAKLFLLLLMTFTSPHIHASQKRKIAYDSNYGTHMQALVTAVANTDGAVLELGAGDFSTPLLHALCSVKKRFLLTTDTSSNWLKLFLDLQTDWHKFQHIPAYVVGRSLDLMTGGVPEAWDEVKNDRHWSVVFVDHAPGTRRIVDVQRLRSNVDVFVMHDTEDEKYNWEPTLSSFKYRYVYTRYQVETSVVSDTIDVTQWFNK